MAKVVRITIHSAIILGGAFLALVANGLTAEQSMILKDGLPAEALVINSRYLTWESDRCDEHRNNPCTAANLLKFSTQDGQQIQVQYLTQHPHKIGSKFSIIYLPANPQMWERPERLREHPWVVVLMGIAFSIVGVGLLLRTLLS